MNLLINFYKDDVSKEASRLMKQVESRSFELVFDESEKRNLPPESVEKLEQVLKKYSKLNRQYINIGDNSCDNVAVLEALGLGAYAKKYSVVLDFSEQLALILNRLCGCNVDSIKSIHNYSNVSRAILNASFSDLKGYKFDCFLGLDPKLDKYIVNMVNAVNVEKSNSENVGTAFVKRFYSAILAELGYVKGYCALELKQKYSLVIRSKTFASVIASAECVIDDVLEFGTEDNIIATVPVRTYEKLGYLSEVIA